MYEYKIIETTHRYAVKSDKSALAVIVTSIIGAEPDAKEGYINMDDKDNMYVIARNYEDACKIVCKHYHDAYIKETIKLNGDMAQQFNDEEQIDPCDDPSAYCYEG